MPTIHSERHGGALHLGKQPASSLRPDTVLYSELRASLSKAALLPKVPAKFGHGKDFRNGPPPGWGMFGNGPSDDGSIPQDWAAYNGAGDCFFAGEYHRLKASAKNSKRAVPRISARRVLETYAQRTGYDPQSGDGDVGSDPQAQLATMQSEGLVDDDGNVYKIGHVVALTPGNLSELWEAAYLFENVGIGVVVTDAQERQFAQHKPWEWVAGSSQVGGHYVIVEGRPDHNHGCLISWGEYVRFGLPFYEKQNDESFAYIDPERYSQVTGETAEGYKDQDLEKFLTLVAATAL